MFLISSYGAPLARRASYLALPSSLFGPDGTVNYDYIMTNSINSLLIGSKCIPMAHTLTIVEPIWPMLQNLSKTLMFTIGEYKQLLFIMNTHAGPYLPLLRECGLNVTHEDVTDISLDSLKFIMKQQQIEESRTNDYKQKSKNCIYVIRYVN